MHISEGVLSAPVLGAGMVMAAAGTAVGLKKLKEDKIPQAAILSAAFFVASLVHVPIGPSSAHLILNGILGLMLGWVAFPSILIALLLQGVLFQFGGITTLGVNTVIMATPAVLCYYLFASLVHKPGAISYAACFACGFLSVCFSSLLVGAALMFTQESFLEVAWAVVITHFPVMFIEGLVAVFCVGFLKKVQPELLPKWSEAQQQAAMESRTTMVEKQV
ncbi:cobalt transporter CbiM [uncultured Desulfobacter sp.]|uniref:cobalt transporter CbiM n=1 Tax=uncultured Desulfobacter sp. TaxID=240139 RepID=UPI0029F4CBB1|nr:cobalt transporter CbiM [uncultured Desulfobacter sp.]